MFSSAKAALRKLKTRLNQSYAPFLPLVDGLIHVGANIGQERDLYARFDLRVLWVEPIPEIYEKLRENLRHYPKQAAYQALVTDQDGEQKTFHISSNGGASSSILPFKKHQEMWPEVKMTGSRELVTTTLPTLLQREQIELSAYQALILDTQGSELLVLKGSESILHHFEYIQVEVADFESYEGCCRVEEVESFLAKHHFQEQQRNAFKSDQKLGNYYDIIYRKQPPI